MVAELSALILGIAAAVRIDVTVSVRLTVSASLSPGFQPAASDDLAVRPATEPAAVVSQSDSF